MYWTRNLARLLARAQFVVTEHEIASEARLSGVLDVQNGAIRCNALTDVADGNGLLKYLLQLKLPTREDGQPQPTRRGYLLKEGAVGELIALLSIYYQARFYLLASFLLPGEQGIKVKSEYSPLHRPCPPDLDPVVFTAKTRDLSSGFGDFLTRVAAVEPRYHQDIILAFHHYGRALREIGIDEEMVFVRLVSAVEVLAKGVGLAEEDVLHGKSFEELVRTDQLSLQEAESMRTTFETRKAKARFVKFLETHSKGFFKGGRRKAQAAWIPRAKLREVAVAVYDARSAYLHQGEPMYLSVRVRPWWQRWDTDPSLGMSIGDRRFDKKQKLPYPHFFHSLVRHCALRYVETLQ
jgi:hypothetical protein